jgi:hypothetical protein
VKEKLSPEALELINRMSAASHSRDAPNAAALEILSRALLVMAEVRDLCTPERLPGRFSQRQSLQQNAVAMMKQIEKLRLQIDPR